MSVPCEHQVTCILDEIARLVELAELHGEPDGRSGKRQWTRFAEGMLLDVTTRLVPPAPLWPVVMHNISRGGFGFWLKRPLEPRSTLFVREFSAEGTRLWLPGRVAHCTRGIRGYLVGAALAFAPRTETSRRVG